MKNYKELLEEILDYGDNVTDRTGIGTRRVFGRTLKFDLSQGFPIITLREINFKNVVGELLWMLSGSTSVKELNDKYGVSFWNPWKNEDDDIGPMYGRQLRNFNGSGHDQFKRLIEKIKENKTDRRLLITTFNPLEADDGVLWPCHGIVIHFNVSKKCKNTCRDIGKNYTKNSLLNLCVYQRSADVPIGLPYNISFYALLMHVVAVLTGLEVGELILMVGDCHIYNNQLDGVKKMIGRYCKMPSFLDVDDFDDIPNNILNSRCDGVADLTLLTPQHFHLNNYYPHPNIKFEVAV